MVWPWISATRRPSALPPGLAPPKALSNASFRSHDLTRAIAASGANGLVPKRDAGTLLIQALEQLRRHQSYFPPRIADWVRDATFSSKGESVEAQRSACLTPREREVIQLIAGGKSSKEVGDALGISTKTAETHRANLMRKLELHSVSELVGAYGHGRHAGSSLHSCPPRSGCQLGQSTASPALTQLDLAERSEPRSRSEP